MAYSLPPRAAELVAQLGLQPHPEGGYYREVFRSPAAVQTTDGRESRSAITTIDFLLARGQFSAWHRVASDEVWHLLEGGPLRLWLVPPSLDRIEQITLDAVGQGTAPRHVVPAGWWQAAEPLDGFAYVGATVGPGFDFTDFSFARGSEAQSAIQALHADAHRLM
ncbi:cupin domain-containing protein [Piscinibacter terrae]|uniref:Cupin domain-containing protein n=1 Tax=Piscinibacter terrae TaxID=2496871 RepID=A0A3N7HUZ5_9BURK|nr:cupin domain-containing protein [Albitalea terrae]RQP24771.1 cupin domain-containing protein [Albitalea terrae]